MTTLEIIFPHTELTKLATDEAPTAKSLLLLRKEVYANARSVECDEGGGVHGHLGLIMPAAAYLLLTGVAWQDPANPGALTVVAHTTAVQIATMTATHKDEMIAHRTFQKVEAHLKSQIIAAVPNEFISALEDPVHGFSDVTPAEMMEHLHTVYGAVTPEDLEENEASLSNEWNPNTPTETVFDNANKAMAFAAIPPAAREAATSLMSGCDVDLAWDGFTSIVEAMYALAGAPVSGLCHRQGQAKLQRPTAALTPDGDTANTQLRFHLRRWRRLREVVRLWPNFPAATTGPAGNVWKAVRNAEPRGSCFSCQGFGLTSCLSSKPS